MPLLPAKEVDGWEDADVTAESTEENAGENAEDSTEETPKRRRRGRWLRLFALAVALLVLSGAGVGWWLYERLDGNIKTDTRTENELRKFAAERPVALVRDAQNILLIGSDNRGGKGNGKYGKDTGTQRSDTTILLHLQAGGKSATAISIPRDLMVDIPSCTQADGKRGKAKFAQFNWAFEFGGPACTIRTVEKLTGIRVDHHMIVDFSGFKKMVNAVGGVEVCLKDPIDDDEAHLRLPEGRQVLQGEQALGYVRARYSIGDGSDTERIGRQQEFLGALVKKLQSNGVLLNPTRLYPVLDAATSSLTTDPGLSSLKDLYDLVRGMRNIPREKIRFLTIPRQPYTYNRNRDELVQPDADRLFRQLRLDRPVPVAKTVTHASGDDPKSGKSTPYEGTTAAHDMCR
ncbi:LCP family protein [Streptomyces sp. NBS 14/10]|uniref:LCP family protein n=1 Tax=Streptomyces sp. NBS 14/10 TaxID=1945643 RepID=UPI000B7D884B|nr:LCP family protein [Streptomyces sp. NBS 14/10]KAK1181509.1 LCP family protein [Streptomyces sp. NBS 14/10]NUS89162.1 LCP family protein [Streptomyces sp.]